MRTVAIMNQKGGCGKTTTAVNLAACLAKLGKKTLLVDMDPQGHCGVGLAVPEEQVERSVYDALVEPEDGAKGVTLDQIAWQIATDFDLAPSNLRLAAFEQVYAGRAGREDRLSLALDKVKSKYDWCVIDNPPGVGLLTFNALKACDEVIVPVETGFFSLHGLAKMMETLDELKERIGKRTQVRVLPTLYDTRTKLAREVLSELRAKFRDHLMTSTVNFNTKLKEAASFGQPITEYDPGSRGYKDFANLARELMGDRPAAVEAVEPEKMTRPQELVQRARQLAQLTNVKFGRGTSLAGGPSILADEVSASTATSNGRSVFASATAEKSSAATPAKPEPKSLSTAEKLDAFYGVRQIGGEVEFAAKFGDAKRVLVAGDFNGWSPMGTPLVRSGEPGHWATRLPLEPGAYRYRFIVDGEWVNDPHNDRVETNEYGQLNNVVEVAEPATA